MTDTINTNDHQIIIEQIRMNIAKFAYDLMSKQIIEIFEDSRHNKGGSMTVPKSLVENLSMFEQKRFSDLNDEEKKNFLRHADSVIESIKISVGL